MAKLLALSSRGVQHKRLEGEVANRFIFIQREVKKGLIKSKRIIDPLLKWYSASWFNLQARILGDVRSPSPGGDYNYHGNKSKITRIYQCLTLKNSLEHWHPIQHLVSWHSCLFLAQPNKNGSDTLSAEQVGARTRWRRAQFRFKTALATLVLSSTSGKSFHKKSSVPRCRGLRLSHGQRGLWWTGTAPGQTHRTRFPFSRCQTAAALRWFVWWAVSFLWFS